MVIWRQLFPVLQRKIPAHRNQKVLRLLDKAAVTYHHLFENSNHNATSNGEAVVLQRLHERGALSVVFDVGANVGDYSRLVRKTSPTCKIFAFEPVRATYDKLARANVGGDITLINKALGEKVGQAEIALPDDSGIASLLVETQAAAGRKARPEMIEVERGDSFLLSHPEIREISLLKIDTEGFEPWVLRGFADRLKTAIAVQFEYGRANLFAKYFLHDYFDTYGRDYLIGKIFPGGVTFYETYDWNMDDLIGPNYLMVRRDRPDLAAALQMTSA